MEILIGFLVLVYAAVVIRILVAWLQLPSGDQISGHYSPTATLSVIVAARNEESFVPGLIKALAAQTYPRHLLEIILVDDHSTDKTFEAAQEMAIKAGLSDFKIISLEDEGAGKGKKAALAQGIKQAKGEFICTTDADCMPGTDWLQSLAQEAETKKAVFVSGPVCYYSGKSLLTKLQTLEFAGLIAIGGASIKLQQPNMCNGANLLFSREIFNKVGGYSGNEQIASGDDEFLLHKIAAACPARYSFLKSERALVFTWPKATLPELLQQRIRWAGKWKHYQHKSPKLLALLIAVVYGALLAALCFASAGVISWQYLFSIICFKFVVEALFFSAVLRFFKLGRLFWLVILFQLLHPPFVLAVAFATLQGRFTWKGRRIEEV